MIIYGIYTAYPFKENAQFKTNDQMLTDILGCFLAGPFETRQSRVLLILILNNCSMWGDSRIEALVSISVDGDDRLMRKAIDMFDNSRLPNGLTQSRYPSYIVQVIPTYSLLWVTMLHDYHLYKNDDQFVRSHIPGMKAVLDWWIAKVDKKGMPTQMGMVGILPIGLMVFKMEYHRVPMMVIQHQSRYNW